MIRISGTTRMAGMTCITRINRMTRIPRMTMLTGGDWDDCDEKDMLKNFGH